ncbi:MAG: thiamine pyrophosphate-dependent dehydrogenase E1 component subunit alpha [Deltaproteobacteria bacterium]|nr:thiamine pyrophosphate-dependent dehydrogenase E1 component subunit alpha [Deltaproteobacteria bacterium]
MTIVREDQDLALRLYRAMSLIATFQEEAEAAAGRGEFRGGYSNSRGEEAVSAGVCLAMEAPDVLYPGLHGIGDVLARGSEPRLVMAELFGRATGLTRGKSGRLHMSDVQRNTMPINGIVAASLPLAAGSALAAKLRRDGVVTVCFFGDRAANEGVFHETLNFVGLWKLPILLVAINNAPPESMEPLCEHNASGSLAELARVHGIETAIIDGTDALSVYRQASEVLQSIRRSPAPFFLECLTYPLDEITREETVAVLEGLRASGQRPSRGELRRRISEILAQKPAEWWTERDPLKKLEAEILKSAAAQETELATTRSEVRAVVQDAIAFARQSPDPPLEAAVSGVYRE